MGGNYVHPSTPTYKVWPCRHLLDKPSKNCKLLNINDNCPEVGYCGQLLMSDQEEGDMETLRKGSSLMSWMMLFYPKEDTLKVSFGYVY